MSVQVYICLSDGFSSSTSMFPIVSGRDSAASAENTGSWLCGLFLRDFFLDPPPWGKVGAEGDGWVHESAAERGRMNREGGVKCEAEVRNITFS